VEEAEGKQSIGKGKLKPRMVYPACPERSEGKGVNLRGFFLSVNINILTIIVLYTIKQVCEEASKK
jgi:hypothetical protein